MSKRIPIILGFLLLALAIWLQVTPQPLVRLVLLRLEHIAYDVGLRAQLLGTPKKIQETSVAIIDVDDKSISQEGRWPWSRAKLANLVDNLQAAGAVVIAFDMIFPLPEKNIVEEVETALNNQKLNSVKIELALQKIHSYFDSDAKFSYSMSDGDVVMGFSFLNYPGVVGSLPAPLMQLTTPAEKELEITEMNGVDGINPIIAKGVKNAGFINVFPDSDGIIRYAPLLLRYQGALYPSLSLEAVRVFLFANVKLVTGMYGSTERLEGVQINDYVIPTNAKGEVIIPFMGRGFTFPYFSATDVLHNKIPPQALSGKIVFIGASAVGLGDLKATAIQNVYPGVEVHATIAEGILKKQFYYKPAWGFGVEIFLILFLGTLLVLVCPYLGPRVLSLIIFTLPIILLLGNNLLRQKAGLLIDIFIPIVMSIIIALANMIYGYLFEARKREHLKGMFGQYVPEEHIDAMLKSQNSYGLSGEDREMTVLFADIRNFTSISEPLTATQLKDYLNTYLNPMTEVIFFHHGTIDKYVGDLIMAFWGAPLPDTDHAKNALNAALAMQREVVKLNQDPTMSTLSIGIGLNSGRMSVGDMGSKFRRNYTVLGDAVNLGSRVESLTKYYGVKIIASENTVKYQDEFLFCLLDKVRVKGKAQGVSIYEVVCKKEDANDEIVKEIAKHEEAMLYYFQQKWFDAKARFILLNQHFPDKKIYPLYLERIEHFIQNPPPSDWDGVYTLQHK